MRRKRRSRLVTSEGHPLADSVCQYPSCGKPASALASVGGLATNLNLCQYHLRQATDRPGVAEFLESIFSASAADRIVASAPEGAFRSLSKSQFLSEVLKRLDDAQYFEGAYLPSCFHPAWFFTLQAEAAARHEADGSSGEASPGSSAMDEGVQRLLFSGQAERTRVLIRLSGVSYASKVRAVITDERLIGVLVAETCEKITEFYSEERPSRTVRPITIGHERIPYIFSDAVITAQRSSAASPVEHAIMSTDQQVIDFERRCFDSLEAATSRGVRTMRDELRDFIRDALTPAL